MRLIHPRPRPSWFSRCARRFLPGGPPSGRSFVEVHALREGILADALAWRRTRRGGSQAALDESVRRGDVWSEKDPTSGQEWWFRRRIQKVHKKGMKEVSRYPVHPSFS